MPCGETTVTKKREVRPLQFRLRGVDSRHPYRRARGIWEQTADIFGIGFYGGPGLMSRRVVIPIHNELGGLVAYCGRALDGGNRVIGLGRFLEFHSSTQCPVSIVHFPVCTRKQ